MSPDQAPEVVGSTIAGPAVLIGEAMLIGQAVPIGEVVRAGPRSAPEGSASVVRIR